MRQDNDEPSIEEGFMFTADCVGIGKKGDGIFKTDGFVVIVPETEEGKRYTVEVTKVLRNFAFGQVVEDED